MRVIHHGAGRGDDGDGGQPRVVAGADHGVHAFAVATQTLAPGAGGTLPPADRHERVAVALMGSGKLLVEGEPQRFQAPCTLVLPDGADCVVVNIGAVPLHLVWVSAPATNEILRREPT
jgi:mannose-6-phosphate isomerase-like protein (cupin superfamily)